MDFKNILSTFNQIYSKVEENKIDKSDDKHSEAYYAGYDEYEMNPDYMENPYDPDTEQLLHMEWESGYKDAKRRQPNRDYALGKERSEDDYFESVHNTKTSLKNYIKVTEAGLTPTQTLIPGFQAGQNKGQPTVLNVNDPSLKAALDVAAKNKKVTAVGMPQTGTTTTPTTASSSTTGSMPAGQQQVTEKFDEPVEVNPAEKGKYKGKNKSELTTMYNKLKKSGPHKKGSPGYGRMRELAFAIRAKSGWGKVQESTENMVEQSSNTKAIDMVVDELDKWFEYLNTGKDLDEVSESDIKTALTTSDDPLAKKLWVKMLEVRDRDYRSYEKMISDIVNAAEKRYESKYDDLNEVDIPSDDMDMGAGLGAGRSQDVFETDHVEEGGLQAYLGKKKYGKDGMEALQKAGREHASKQTMANIRAKYDKMDEGMMEGSKHASRPGTQKRPGSAEQAQKAVDRKKEVKSDYEKRKAEAEKNKGVAAGSKPDFLDLDKDGNKTEPMKKAARDMKKKKVNESLHRHSAARLLGKSHALAKEGYNCKYDDMTEAQEYHEGFKEGLDECYGQQPIVGLVKETDTVPATVRGMADNAMETHDPSHDDAKLSQKGIDFVCDQVQDYLDMQMIDKSLDEINEDDIISALDETDRGRKLWSKIDILGTRDYNKIINDIIDACKQRKSDIDVINEIDLDEVSRGEYIRQKDAEAERKGKKSFTAFGQDFNTDEVKETSMNAFENWEKQLNGLLHEGLSVSISKGHQGSPDSVTVSAQDAEAEQLLGLIKNAGLDLFGDETSSQQDNDYLGQKPGGIEVVDDHDGMMDLIKKITHGPESSSDDYQDEESCDEMDETLAGAAVGGAAGAALTKTPSGAIAGAKIGDKLSDMTSEETVEEEKCNECGYMESKCECDEEKLDEVESSDQMTYEVAEDKNLNEWANEAGKKGTDAQFEQDIEFMTKIISGGLNKPKSTGQTTIPVIPGQEVRMEDPMSYAKLAGVKK